MRYLIIIGLYIAFHSAVGQQKQDQLELISMAQLKSIDDKRFDLSGIVQVKDKYYIIADKSWNTNVYQLKFHKDKWFAIEEFLFDIKEESMDQEAVDSDGERFFIANEKNGKIYTIVPDNDPEELKVNFEEANESPSSWGNAGWEGLAIDTTSQILYLVKERQPRYILAVDLETLNIVDKFNVPETESNDFADAKFENGFLYLLERNGNYVTKVNPKTHEVISKFSYKHICSSPPPNGKLYQQSKYGMAEALLLTPTEVWIGIDNNGKDVTLHASEKYNIEGNKPVIIKFKRPTGF